MNYNHKTDNHKSSSPGPGSKKVPGKSADPEAEKIEREDDDAQLVPDEDDFDEEYGDLDGANNDVATPEADQGLENF